jgi:hypothetical protein
VDEWVEMGTQNWACSIIRLWYAAHELARDCLFGPATKDAGTAFSRYTPRLQVINDGVVNFMETEQCVAHLTAINDDEDVTVQQLVRTGYQLCR